MVFFARIHTIATYAGIVAFFAFFLRSGFSAAFGSVATGFGVALSAYGQGTFRSAGNFTLLPGARRFWLRHFESVFELQNYSALRLRSVTASIVLPSEG